MNFQCLNILSSFDFEADFSHFSHFWLKMADGMVENMFPG